MGTEIPTSIYFLVDAGTTLKGFAGVGSRDFHKGPKAAK